MIEYPKWLYQHGRSPVIVQDAEAHAALGPGWYTSPVDAEAAAGDIGQLAQVEDPSVPQASAPSSTEDAERQAIYGANVGDIVSRLSGASQATLEKVRRFESENPKGSRVGVMKAVEKALAALAPPPPPPPADPVAPADVPVAPVAVVEPVVAPAAPAVDPTLQK